MPSAARPEGRTAGTNRRPARCCRRGQRDRHALPHRDPARVGKAHPRATAPVSPSGRNAGPSGRPAARGPAPRRRCASFHAPAAVHLQLQPRDEPGAPIPAIAVAPPVQSKTDVRLIGLPPGRRRQVHRAGRAGHPVGADLCRLRWIPGCDGGVAERFRVRRELLGPTPPAAIRRARQTDLRRPDPTGRKRDEQDARAQSPEVRIGNGMTGEVRSVLLAARRRNFIAVARPT
jgi:hypothetical protein